MTPTQAIIGLWALSGIAFWISCISYNPPTRWRSERRETGWAEAAFLYFPAFVIGGPLWWVALAYFRLRRARS